MIGSKKIKIAFFLPNLEGGGAERNVVNLLNNLNKEKYDLSIVLGKKEGAFIGEIPEYVSLVNFGLKSSYSLVLFLKLIKYFRQEKANIFVSAFPRFNIISLLARIFSGSKIKIIITEHTTFSFLPLTAKVISHKLFARFPLPVLIKSIYPKADAIICVSKGVAIDLCKFIHCLDKIRVVYNPITNQKIKDLAEEEINHPWFFDSQIPIILAIGRLAKTKDYPNLIGAFKKILDKMPANLVILGEGSEREKLEKLAYKLGLSNNIAFLGFQSNIYKYIKRASVFVLSSLQEGFGNVIIEAMACGTPVVSTDCLSGPREIIEHGKNGILVPVADKEILAMAIINVLNSPELRNKFSEAGEKRAEHFSIEKSVKEYERIFNTI